MAKRSGGLRFQPSGGEKKPAIPTGKKQRVDIERLANDGRGIGFVFALWLLAKGSGHLRVARRHVAIEPATMWRIARLSGTGTFSTFQWRFSQLSPSSLGRRNG